MKLLTFVILLFPLFMNAQQASKKEVGMASYYADKFVGRRTASGDVYRHDSLTAAHKTLPFGTKLRITHVANGRSVVVRVNDRGMKGLNRVVDLSRSAAEELGMISSGVAKVEVEILN
ncbi:MAG: septal ring lytic transglycosylase RlpA family protein [Bacteroidia bacterium]|jgi:rare lipoprotein A